MVMMTLGDLIDRYHPHLLDETVGVQRSWEDTFKYTLKIYPRHTPLEAFDLDRLAAEMTASGVNQAFVNGYIERWRRVIGHIRV
ncbi:hypothetical protein [Aliirhizobium cellulosilyticum]|jgi:hypothetical protein|uniref:Uncharacterized protein n=1 Tax=Aliirhizobium cellulosilyticum TaxID=393664 RepID=A0A7W6TLK2_9HYPH|nr:hypothetical protein [Rhizobium cellulosilyticum]MBB4351823.1 hypothetical protein [Rhizobium cellulosilyticum]MBB4415058.1 hypothetical protein [Rhizobium cellulosilyticum]MBB4449750.1 hypothetical protein [Rhizobium cellulosilyticum]